MTLRDGMRREVEGGFMMGNTCISMADSEGHHIGGYKHAALKDRMNANIIGSDNIHGMLFMVKTRNLPKNSMARDQS